jgi:hypothetical protein
MGQILVDLLELILSTRGGYNKYSLILVTNFL